MSKNKKIIISILILLVVSVLIFWAVSLSKGSPLENTVGENPDTKATSTPQTVTNSSAKVKSSLYLNKDGFYVIQYTNSGFVPKTIQIPKGKSVKFINASSRGMRIFTSDVSDPKFTELNQPNTVSKGSSYTLSLPNGGFWDYYNQTYPSHKASILVY